jgi:glycosyltransferase involved in cell wall biosynthesis
MAQAARRVGDIDRRRCRRAFEERFTAERMVKEYVQLYEQMIREASMSEPFSSDY